MKQLALILILLLCTNTVLEYIVFPMLLHISVNIVVYFLIGVVVLVVWHYKSKKINNREKI